MTIFALELERLAKENMNHEEAKDLQPLSEQEIKERLKEFPGWEFDGNKISKSFEFPSFNDVLALIVALTPFCNKIDHHPDIYWSYKDATFCLTRYSIGGKVTERDFAVASRIEELYGFNSGD